MYNLYCTSYLLLLHRVGGRERERSTIQIKYKCIVLLLYNNPYMHLPHTLTPLFSVPVSCGFKERSRLIDQQYSTDREKLQKIRLLMVRLENRHLLCRLKESSLSFIAGVPRRLGGTGRSPFCRGRLMRFPAELSLHSTRNASLSSTAKVCVCLFAFECVCVYLDS